MLYRELILRYCRGFGIQFADAEDIRQEVMLNLCRAMPGFRYDRSRGRFRSYLRTGVRHSIQNHFRRKNQGVQALNTSVDGKPVSDHDHAWEREWMLHHYRLAMDFLRTTVEPASINIFNALMSGQSVEAVAARFDTKTDAVSKVKQRIKHRLSERIAAQVREEDVGFE